MSGFSSRQLKKISRQPDPNLIQTRTTDSKQLRYIPGWVAIAEANEIFGPSGWDRHTIHLEKLFDRSSAERTSCGYSARVKVVVRAGNTTITREGTGFGYAAARPTSEAHEIALKAAETDATKRALATFGNRFGLSLYHTANRGSGISHLTPDRGFVLFTPDGTELSKGLSGEAFASGLRQIIEQASSPDAIASLMGHNAHFLSALKSGFPHLISRSGRHFSRILEDLAAKRKAALLEQSPLRSASRSDLNSGEKSEPHLATLDPNLQSQSNFRVAAPAQVSHEDRRPPNRENDRTITQVSNASRIVYGPAIDKSILTYALDRRIRSKQHLSRVGAQPCSICAETPCHAHHITFAQPRGLAIKVSDEFTVPLCATHHNGLHQCKAEKMWWKEQGIDPLLIAATLWEGTLRCLTS